MSLLSERLRKGKVGSPFCLGAAASVVFLVGFLLSTSIKPPKIAPLLQIPTVGAWPFPFPTSNARSSSSSTAQLHQGGILNQTRDRNVSVVANVEEDGHRLEAEGVGNATEKKETPMQGSAGSTVSSSGGNSSVGDQGDSAARVPGNEERLAGRGEGSLRGCDIFDGEWVRDDSKPYYPAGSCPYIDADFDCHRNCRPDEEFVKWRWKPNGCEVPSLNATDFLERLRGKKLVFVGDSLNRNMWESLVCILRHSIRDKKRVYEISGRREFKKKGFYAFRFEDYNCSVDFVSSPFIVRESSFKGSKGSFETLRLDLMDGTTSMYHDADVIVFNTGHWWTHEKTSRGEDYYQEGNRVYPRLKVLDAYKRALNTWAKWVDTNIDSNRTQVFFRGFSVTHFRGGPWNSGGKCHKESEPIFDQKYLKKYPSKMKVLEHVLHGMKTPVTYLNISRLTAYRKDAHPSIYRMVYKTDEERAAAERVQDCSHWCLPGVPDTWNELLYVSILQSQNPS